MLTPPIIVLEKDDGSLKVYDSADDARISQDVESIDFNNGEYVFFDSSGRMLEYEIRKVNRKIMFGLFSAKAEQIGFKNAEDEPTHREELRAAIINHLSNQTEISQNDSLESLVKKLVQMQRP